MKVLLDTPALLCALGAKERLPNYTLGLLESRDNEVFFSAASIWEIAIKAKLGRADFDNDPALIEREARSVDFVELPVRAAHAIAVGSLPQIHRDPFDRLLLAQALFEPAWLITADAVLAQYEGPVRFISPRKAGSSRR